MQKERVINALGYTVRRAYVDDFFLRHISTITPKRRVIDVGGHKTRKRGLFNLNHYSLQVVYVNLTSAKGADIQADAAKLPIDAGAFDVAICAELLEHVREPRMVLAEVHRVLKTGGLVFITAPFLYRSHGDPYDFGRYTEHYWRCTLEELGFYAIQIERQGTFFSVLVDFFKQYGDAKWRRPWRLVLRWPLAWLQQWARRQEQKQSVLTDPFLSSFTTGFGIVAQRCEESPSIGAAPAMTDANRPRSAGIFK